MVQWVKVPKVREFEFGPQDPCETGHSCIDNPSLSIRWQEEKQRGDSMDTWAI